MPPEFEGQEHVAGLILFYEHESQFVELLEHVAHYTAHALINTKKDTLTVVNGGNLIKRIRTGASWQRNSIHTTNSAS